MASPVIYPSRLTAPRFKVFEISFECSLATCPMIISEKSRKLEKNSDMDVYSKLSTFPDANECFYLCDTLQWSAPPLRPYRALS